MFSSGCFEVGCYCAARVDLGLGIPMPQSPRGCGDRCLCSQLASPFYFVCFLLRKHLPVQPGWLELAVPSRTQVQTVSCIKITNSSFGPGVNSAALSGVEWGQHTSRGWGHCEHATLPAHQARHHLGTCWYPRADASSCPGAPKSRQGLGRPWRLEGSKLKPAGCPCLELPGSVEAGLEARVLLLSWLPLIHKV